jgi:hypothetical protein
MSSLKNTEGYEANAKGSYFILNVEYTPGQGGYLWSCLIIIFFIFFILLISIQPRCDVLDQTILRRKAEIS